MPEFGSPEASTPHALVIDDLLMFRDVPIQDCCAEGDEVSVPTGTLGVGGSQWRRRARRRRARRKAGSPGAIESAQTDSGGVPLAPVLARYTEVGLRYKAEKVRDYSAEQDLLGYTLDWNVLRGSLPRYHALAQAVRSLERRMWAQPREVERLVGRFTHWFLLHRAALSIFNAVYAFATKVGERRARLWPSVLRELQRALAVLPLVHSDLARPAARTLIQTDACDTGGAVVYTRAVPHAQLAAECRRPRGKLSRRFWPRGSRASGEEDDSWTVRAALAAAFEAPVDADVWKIAARRQYRKEQHINEKEADSAVTGVRWAARSPHTRNCRLVLMSDSTAVVGAFRKGRSSRPGMLRQCRRLAAICLAEAISVEMRHIPSERNMRPTVRPMSWSHQW